MFLTSYQGVYFYDYYFLLLAIYYLVNIDFKKIKNIIINTKLVLFNSIGTFILNFGLNIWLIPIYGILGAAIATLTSLTIIGINRVTQVYFILIINYILL